MDSAASVTIDAGVLAIPDLGCEKDDAFKYVETLLDWSKLLNAPWIAIYMSERASWTLSKDRLYPLREPLKKLFSYHGIVAYDVNTVATVVNKILSTTPSFEDHYRVKDVLSEGLETEPDVIRLTSNKHLRSDLERCIVLIAILRKHCAQLLDGHYLILKEAPGKTIRVRAKIHDIEHDRSDIVGLPRPPKFFEGDVLACDDFRGLIDCLDASAILVGASDDTGIKLAVRIALFKDAISQGETPDWGGGMALNVGANFRESCQRICADQGSAMPSKIIRSIIETVMGQNLPAVHAIRKGAGSNAPPRTRGSDKAQRRDIDREFHLHYWQCGDGTVELASVVYHNDFSIPK